MRTRPPPKLPSTDAGSSARSTLALAGVAIGSVAVGSVALATALAFWPVTHNGFVNWDDYDVLVSNTSLRLPPAGLIAWAFSTVHMHHYQPLSWLTWAWLGGSPQDASRVHALSLALHVLNVGLLTWVAALLAHRPGRHTTAWWAAAAGAALFAVHPLRVEVVAWASALPYLLSFALLLPSVGLWIGWVRKDRAWWLWAAVALYGLSQLARVTAPLMPLVFAALAWVDRGARPRSMTTIARAALPFAAVAIPLAIVEAGAREVETLADVGVGPRVAAALTSPTLYLWRTLVPGGLTPLDVLPRVSVVDWGEAAMAVAAFAAAVALTWRLVSRHVAVAVWGSYLVLLIPVLGLTPSGLQLTADRYTYGPAMVLSVALAAAIATFRVPWRQGLLVVAGVATVALVPASRAQGAYWHDSVSLWSRALELDANNDVAAYNLALALREAGRPDDAIAQYERLVALVPDHDLGRRQLSSMLADREFASANEAASAGRFDEAITGFDRTLQHDPSRIQARANRGMALLSRGDLARGAADLEAAVAVGIDDPAVSNALAFSWASVNRTADAIALLTRMQARHPDDLSLSSNLARLLLTAEPPALRDPGQAYLLTAQLVQATGGHDPRLLDTLALAFAAMGQPEDARQALIRAVSLAREAGDVELAAQLGRRLAALPR